MLEELNSRHGIADHLRFVAGPNNLPVARIENVHATAEIHLHGAHVTGFQPRNRKPVLWMSRNAIFNPPKPIRGGVPICWPWFGVPGEHPERPQHGFARNRQWEVTESRALAAGETVIEFGLVHDADSLAIWPHEFRLGYRVTVGMSLTMALTFNNPGEIPVEAGVALHTYFAVGDVAGIRISGLDSREYHDQLDGMKIKQQAGDISIGEEVDRIYLDTEDECVIHDPNWNRRIRVAKSGSRSTVVWNPWIEKSKRMLDYPDDGYPEMVCIETTNAARDVRTVPAGDSHTVSQTVSVE